MNRIKELRKSKKLSQEQLAELVFVGQTAVSQWEKGKSFPSAETQGLLADVFGVSVDYLLGRANDKKEKTPSEEGVALDDFTYALYDETKDLTEEDKKMLLGMAKMLKERKDKEK